MSVILLRILIGSDLIGIAICLYNIIKNKKKPYVTLIIFALIIVFGIIFLINEEYKTGIGYVTVWGGEDVLAFYGSFLSLMGTVILGYVSLYQNKKANDVNEQLAKRQLKLIDYDSKMEKLRKINYTFEELFKKIDISVLRKIFSIGSLEEYISLREELFLAQKIIEKNRVTLDFIKEFSINCNCQQCERCKNNCEYRFLSNQLKKNLYNFREQYYQYVVDYFKITDNIINGINRLIQSIRVEDENKQYQLQLKEILNNDEKYEQKIMMIEMAITVTGKKEYYKYLDDVKKSFEKSNNKEILEYIQRLMDENRKLNYSISDFRREVCNDTNITKIYDQYDDLKLKAMNYQNEIQIEIDKLKQNLINL